MLSIRTFLAGSFLLLSACGDSDSDFARPREKRKQPVDLVLLQNGRPDPSVLAEEQVVRRGNGEEPVTLDPHLAEGSPSAHILRDLFEGLTTESPDGKIIPGVAARWNISRDARTYTFYLRRDNFWSNGDPLLAEDFVYSLRRSANPETASSSAVMLLPIHNAREVLAGELPVEELGISLLDEFTLQITLAGPTPYFLGLLAHPVTYPVNRRNIEEYGDQFSRPGKLVSNGAYLLQSWNPRVSIELRKNMLYREAEQTLIERVVYLPIEELSAEVTQFRSGGLEWTNEVPNNQFKWLERYYPDELVVSPWMGSYFFGFNVATEPFVENPDLRQALTLAIDRQVITDKVTQFGEKPSFALVPPGIDGYVPFSPEYADWTQEQRNDKARRLYDRAGYSEEDPLRVEIRYNTSENHKKIALAIASMWKQVLGVHASLVNEEFRVFLQNREQKIITQVFRAGWISDYNDPYSFLEMFRTGHGRNDYAYSNSTFDALLDEVGTERVRARRERLMFEAERVLLSDFVIIPIYTYVTKRLVDQHLRGWENNVMDHHLTRHMYMLKTRVPGAEIPVTPTDSGAEVKPGIDDPPSVEAGIDQSETAEVAAEEAGADTGAPESEEGQAPEKEATAEQEGDGL
jgi:oligopeptide transport system substrate-binding protein